MSADQLQRIGAVLAAHVDMAKGFLGDQFAVSIVARHKTGPFHLLLGDDTELALIECLSVLQRMGKHLVRVGEDGSVVPVEPGDADEPTEWDHMVNLLRELVELDASDTAGLQDVIERAGFVLDMVTPEPQTGPGPGQIWIDEASEVTGDGVNAALAPPSVAGVGPVSQGPGGLQLPEGETGPFTIGDMDDAPAVDGRPE